MNFGMGQRLEDITSNVQRSSMRDSCANKDQVNIQCINLVNGIMTMV